jgi:hypothetical protein
MEKLIRFFRNSNIVSQERAEEFAAQFFHKTISKNEFLLRERQICDDSAD